jgi:hypothetical protein
MNREYCCLGVVLYEVIILKESLLNNEAKADVKKINVFFSS